MHRIRLPLKLLLATALTILLAAATLMTERSEYRIDTRNSTVSFKIKQLGINTVEGRFNEFSGRVRFNPNQLETFSVTAEILLSGLATGNSSRDREIKGDAWFAAERFPRIVFSSNSARRLANGQIMIRGDLTIRNVTREVTLTAQIENRSSNAVRFLAQTEINRHDFNVSGGSFLIGDHVRIALDILLRPAV